MNIHLFIACHMFEQEEHSESAYLQQQLTTRTVAAICGEEFPLPLRCVACLHVLGACTSNRESQMTWACLHGWGHC